MAFISDTDVPPQGGKVLEKYGYRFEMTAPPASESPASCNGVAGGAFRIDDKGELTEIK
ncbi:MAG: hypothetical protein AB7U83_03865 [Vicinamibacterales bacterium]